MPFASIAPHPVESGREDAARLLVGYSELRSAFVDPEYAARAIRHYRIPREAVPSDLLAHPQVWAALKDDMPHQAFLRNLGKLGSLGLLDERDADRIERAGDKLHPFAILLAKAVYDTGQGLKGKLAWEPIPALSVALDAAFHRAFGTLALDPDEVPLIALDVSGSMAGSPYGDPVTPIMAEAAMAMVLARQYPQARFVAFSGGTGSAWGWSRIGALSPITIHGQTYQQVLQNIAAENELWGPTEINLPFSEARRDPEITSAIVMTDNETRNKEHAPSIIRDIQRDRPEFRAAVLAFAANEISVLDPNDPHQADFVGMDASLPKLLTMFLGGDLD